MQPWHPRQRSQLIDTWRKICTFPAIQCVSICFPAGAWPRSKFDSYVNTSPVTYSLIQTLCDSTEMIFPQTLELKRVPTTTQGLVAYRALHPEQIHPSVNKAMLNLDIEFDHWHTHNGDRITLDQPMVSGIDFPYDTDAHSFCQEMPQIWLNWNCAGLQELTLRFMDVVGLRPKLDLRHLEFPSLRVLKLYNVALSHSWIVTWITDMGNTLQTLHLVNCPIVVEMVTNHGLDPENYPVGYGNGATVQFHLRWYDLFDTFAKDLPHLKDFFFAHTRLDGGRLGPRHYEWDGMENIWHRELVSGVTKSRYKKYVRGHLVRCDEGVHVSTLELDFDAYTTLLRKTGVVNVPSDPMANLYISS
ncbi:hypothetical protein P154DRAFT_522557 [Amniculicola lignicola CBS 123094]|uniref:F-box domain-containing protein n=1 Tax=Amniculicola lignicola CBS 123094 TaxID=1392246 RepID=A0A6A5WS29_9PLEO|nr:hypothetical protein P154DRAFT_522557 [Amniculicola lignicola CBS 123094]